MSFKFRGSVSCNDNFAGDEKEIEVIISDEFMAEIPEICKWLGQRPLSYACKWDSAAYKFFDEEGNECVPQFQLDGCHAMLYADGHFHFSLEFKHASEGYFTQDFLLEDGVHHEG